MLPQQVALSCPSTCFFSTVILGFQLTSLNTRASPQVIGVGSKPPWIPVQQLQVVVARCFLLWDLLFG